MEQSISFDDLRILFFVFRELKYKGDGVYVSRHQSPTVFRIMQELGVPIVHDTEKNVIQYHMDAFFGGKTL